ncbi:MAG: hypothetical protein SFU99_14860 [Saprospiraceae bacterium]|nr:hypothetical protein [Saprospiraceae bacterium]
MKKTILLFCTLIVLLGTAACSLKEIFEKKEKLPEINSETSKAFGFLLNGKVWLPKGHDSYPRYNVDVDPGFSKGIINISAYRYPKNDGTKDGHQSFAIGADSCNSVGLYPIKRGFRQGFYFWDRDSNCEYSSRDSTCQYDGYLKLTMYDLEKGKFQGEFELTVSKPGCETLNITKGRFAWQF